MDNSKKTAGWGDAGLWKAWVAVMGLLALIVVAILANERAHRLEAAAQRLGTDTHFLAQVLEASLQNGDFSQAQAQVESWGNSQPAVLLVRLSADNGFVLGEFRRQQPKARRHEQTQEIVFSYRGSANLLVEESLEPIYAALTMLAVNLSAAALVMALIGFLLLWNIHKYRQQVRLTWEEVDRRMEAQMALEQLSTQDVLTSLPNRQVFNERLKQEVSESAQFDRRLALLMIDLDDFKSVNDSLGHEQGDLLLQTAASRMSLSLRNYDFLARFGGDAFVAILPSLETEEEVAALVRRLQKVLNKTVRLGHDQVLPSASIGISLYPQDGSMPDELLRNADAAMHSAKQAGRNAHRFYTESLNATLAERNKMDVALHHALSHQQGLSLVYEPQVDIRSGEIVSCEALLRWNREGREVAPEDFLSVAERSAVMARLQGFVIDEVIHQQRLWEAEGLPGYRVDINLGGDRVAINEVLDKLEAHFEQQPGLVAGMGIEITERLLISTGEGLVQRLAAFKKKGVVISLDDFGTGYSSLGQLKYLPVDILKIDKSFVQDVPESVSDSAIVRSVVTMGHAMGQQVLAEGIETQAQYEFIRNVDCDLVQGFLLHQPMTADQLIKLMRSLSQAGNSGLIARS